MTGERLSEPQFPKLDKSAWSFADLGDSSDEKAYWLSRTPEERIHAVEQMRQINYGCDHALGRLQRVFEIAEFIPR